MRNISDQVESFTIRTGDVGELAFLNADQRGGIAPNGKPSKTIDQAGLHLVGGEPGWSAALGVAYTVTYAFRSTAPSSMPSDTAGFSRFNAAQIAQTELALAGWSDVANITFVRVGSGTSGEGAYSNSASILLANYSSGESGAAAFANYPGDPSFSSASGDVWVNSTLSYNRNPLQGGYGALVLVHELGHTIGLSHPGDYNAGEGVEITYANNAEYYEDSLQYTVMSYFDESETGANYQGAYAASPMLDDIAAAQKEYGANTATRTGDTVYGFNSTAGRSWFLASTASTKLIFAAWDAGGVDTFDFSGYAQNQLVDLRAGNFSNVGGLVGNVAIAANVTIENAIGGGGADTLIGNAAGNSLSGLAGDDRLVGGGGGDALFGGAGTNTFVYERATDSDNAHLDIIHDFKAGTDRLDLIALAPSNVSILHHNGGTFVNGGSGASVFQIASINSINGSDILGLTNGLYLVGEDTASTLIGSAKGDTIVGGAANDTIIGGDAGDALFGGAGADIFAYESATNSGNAYLDIIHDFQTGVDKLDLSAMNPTNVSVLHYQGGTFVNGGAGASVFQIASMNDINATDILGLTSGAYIVGDELANTLLGSGFSETIVGGDGNDVIIGGGAADALFGGAGADTFSFWTKTDSTPGAPDIIHDFQTGVDKIDLTALHANGANDHYSLISDANTSYLFVQLNGDTGNDMLILFATPNVHASDILW
ncbi:M10 family metallopeptidase C-terminal domain-containing protein [Caulobacter sp. BK020]|uniref:M10 family metallopeptidase C-terminal domain-containing protein n=1 Tax=Caulobacter sp. BK020 TaxID=2512117 RepID=UPI00104AF39D|nr:M10 family metallopeptidase C-terminal domain-containing protein [Caulobacter sp. BK020]TCS16094.1 serralysin [Caulobacter sp. BK020]